MIGTTNNSKLISLLFGETNLTRTSQWVLGFAVSLLCAITVARLEFLGVLGIAGTLILIPILILLLATELAALYALLLCAFFISIPNRLLEQVPMGIAIDAVILIALLGMLYRALLFQNFSAFHSPLSLVILLWAGMNLFEILNPMAASRAAWFYVVRPAVGYMMVYFITYSSIRTAKRSDTLLYVIFALGLFSGIWGIIQATYGYFSWEYNYVLRHDLVHLVFNYGRWRAIGSIGSPAQFGIIMAVLSAISLALFFQSRSILNRLFLASVFIVTLLGMVFSGTRSAYIIIPIFLVLWVILSRERKFYYFLAVGIIGITVVLLVPSNNYHIQRMQSVLKASEDASYQTRARNKKIIFPWILAHPIGGGLGSTGVWGQRFSPGTFLANFPPDSGLIRVAVELGWVGLLFFLAIYYRVITIGIKTAWRMRPGKHKAIVSAIAGSTVALLLVEWGQEVVGVFPMSILFWMLLAILTRSIQFHDNKTSSL